MKPRPALSRLFALCLLAACATPIAVNEHLSQSSNALGQNRAYGQAIADAAVRLKDYVDKTAEPLVLYIGDLAQHVLSSNDLATKWSEALVVDWNRLVEVEKADQAKIVGYQRKVYVYEHSFWSPVQKRIFFWIKVLAALWTVGWIVVQFAGCLPPPYGWIVGLAGHLLSFGIGKFGGYALLGASKVTAVANGAIRSLGRRLIGEPTLGA